MFRRSTLTRTLHALLVAAAAGVFLVPAMAQQRSAATLLIQVGQVSLLKDNNPVALFVGQGIHADQIVVTGAGAYAKFRVSDGSEFEVFENSQVTFRDRGGSAIDLLNVFLGRVRVYVQHLLGPNPTSVTSPTAVISVRGTIFDVIVDNDDGDTTVSVTEGKVQVQHRLIPTNKPPMLLPGESIHVIHNVPLGQLVDRGGQVQKVLRAVQKGLWDYITMHPGGGGSPLPGGVPGVGGAQGDKTKTGNGGKTGTGAPGAPTPPSAPTPPPPPPPPGGGGGL